MSRAYLYSTPTYPEDELILVLPEGYFEPAIIEVTENVTSNLEVVVFQDPELITVTPETISLPHHVVLKNGRDDIVCACGAHFRHDSRLNNMAVLQRGGDAIQQWVKHYREKETQT